MFLCPANVTFLLAMRWDMFREDRFLGKVLDEWIGDSQEFIHTKLPKLIVVAIIGLLAAIAIPNFIRARTTSQQNACINNLRLIDSSKQQWALEQRQQSSSIPVGTDLQPYLGRSASGELSTNLMSSAWARSASATVVPRSVTSTVEMMSIPASRSSDSSGAKSI